MAEIIHFKPQIPISGGKIPDHAMGNIQFDHVNFFYPSRPHAPVLNQINLQFNKGKIYALVGTSGSGKTTITALLERFYDPQVKKKRL